MGEDETEDLRKYLISKKGLENLKKFYVAAENLAAKEDAKKNQDYMTADLWHNLRKVWIAYVKTKNTLFTLQLYPLFLIRIHIQLNFLMSM